MASTIRFDSTMARAWKRRMDSELDSVKVLMLEISEVSRSVPGSNDTLFKAIEAIGDNELAIWKDVERAFSEFSELTKEIILAFERFGDEAYESIGSIIERRS